MSERTARVSEPLGAFDSVASGVGQVSDNPDSISLMRGSNVCRSEHSPFSIVPERGQVTEDDAEPANNESWRVFHEHETRSNLANDSRHFSPETRAFAADACALACGADVLTGETT
jgi:hypothetical protein